MIPSGLAYAFTNRVVKIIMFYSQNEKFIFKWFTRTVYEADKASDDGTLKSRGRIISEISASALI